MREIKSRTATAVVTGIAVALASTSGAYAASPPADLVFTNGAIYTVNAKQPWVEAVAVAGGKITWVGESKDAKRFIGERTQVVDLKGGYAQPGMVDIHVHPIMGGVKTLYECVFPFTAKPADVAAALSACAAKTPEGQWIRGGQWGSNFFEYHGKELGSPKAFLDAVSTKHPIYLYDDSGHNGWVNTLALEKAKIDGKTANPVGGTIVHGEDGEPNGVLLETAARIYDKVIPSLTDQQFVEAARAASKIALSYGVTSMKDAGAFEPAAKAFGALDKEGGLNQNVAVCIPTPYGARSAALDYDAIDAQSKQYRTPRVDTRFVKIFLDGVPTPARTAAMLDPYVPDKANGSNFRGGIHVDVEQLKKDVTELDKRGYTVKMHAAGDWSVRAGLDAIEAARKANGNSGLRHELAHAGFIGDSDIPRFAKLDAIPDYCPIIWYPSPIIQAVIDAVGPRGNKYWPTRSLIDAGAEIAPGSDWPAAVPDMNPWTGVEALVTRKDPSGATPGLLWPEEAAKLDEAIRIYTVNGARALRLGDRTGSIEVGKSADIVVLDRNLFQVPITDVGDAKVRQTWFEGKLVHEGK